MNNHNAILSAFEHYKSGNLQKAESVLEEILKKQPDNANALNIIGLINYQTGRYDAAIKYFKKALKFSPANARIYLNIGNVLKDMVQSDQAVLYYQKALQFDPNLFEAYHNLGMVLQDKDQPDEAISCYEKALLINPHLADSFYNLGTIFYERGQFDEAITFYQKAVQINPELVEAYFNLGNSFREKEQFDEAIRCYQQFVRLNPSHADAYYYIGNVFATQNKLSEAIESYRQAIAINPVHADALLNKGFALQVRGNFEEALESYHLSLQINPDSVGVYNNLGNLLINLGQVNEAETCFRRAIQINPEFSIPYSNLLFAINYNSRYDAQHIFAEHLQFAELFEKPLLFYNTSYNNDKTSQRRLRIGYISTDFRKHSVAYFIEPILAANSREHFEVFCYSVVPVEDDVTKRLQKHSEHWRNISGMSDEKAAELIQKDGIDILVDLAGHTANNRILLFARKPAPVQINWIGYPATTGLSTIDYKIVDSYTDPPGMTERFYTEKLIRMPETFLCYLPDSDSPDIGELPALTSGHITFGSFNNFAKVSPEILQLWTNILQSIPDSRLIMKAKSLSDKSTREYVAELFSLKGITAGRIELLSWEPSVKRHLENYNRIDIALDTFPYNGTTTTCEAIWMGVPVITLAGKSHASRVGVSLLSNIGISDLIAETPDKYIEITINLSKDLNKLQSLRKILRNMMECSPLTDSKQFTRNLERCYYNIWEDWCNKH